MGERGPAGKPTAMRLLHGDRKDRTNLNEPQPRNVPVPKPDWLSPHASELWDQLAPDLEVMGTVKVTDAVALGSLCESYSRWRRIKQVVDGSSPLLQGREGNLVKNPAYAQLRDATAELRVMLREFGLTPSARAGIRVTVNPGGDVGRLFTGSG